MDECTPRHGVLREGALVVVLVRLHGARRARHAHAPAVDGAPDGRGFGGRGLRGGGGGGGGHGGEDVGGGGGVRGGVRTGGREAGAYTSPR